MDTDYLLNLAVENAIDAFYNRPACNTAETPTPIDRTIRAVLEDGCLRIRLENRLLQGARDGENPMRLEINLLPRVPYAPAPLYDDLSKSAGKIVHYSDCVYTTQDGVLRILSPWGADEVKSVHYEFT